MILETLQALYLISVAGLAILAVKLMFDKVFEEGEA